MRGHVTVLAWLHIVLGGLTLLGAVGFLVVFGGVGLLIGSTTPAGLGHAGLLFGAIGAMFALVFGILAIPQFILGWGLLTQASWARVLGIIMSILVLLHPSFGLGTLLGIYGLFVFFNAETVAMFEGSGRY